MSTHSGMFSESTRDSRAARDHATEDERAWSDADALREMADESRTGALERLIGRYAGLVYGVALRRAGRHELAQEVAQNVFAVLVRKAPALWRTKTPLAAWLHRAAVLEAARLHRNENTRRRVMKEYAAQMELTSTVTLSE